MERGKIMAYKVIYQEAYKDGKKIKVPKLKISETARLFYVPQRTIWAEFEKTHKKT